eukprot:PITA_24588
MDHILQRVVGASHMLLLDGYSDYNQIMVHEDDRDKTTFTTPWGTFHYAMMPFGLKNAGATFQRAMDIAFSNEKDVFLVVYLNDLTVLSNSDEEHLYHLKIVFQQCRKYGISLNPKKCLFAMHEGKLLDHIISKKGIRIDPTRVETIQNIDFPRSKKEIQSFNCKMNFLRCFVPNIVEHLREITNMLKKDSVVKWTKEVIKSFNLGLAFVKALKDFRVYILHSLILAYVPNATAKDVLVQTDPEGRRGKWIAALLEYDVEIKPTKIIKGQGLIKIMVESNFHALDINLIAAMSEEDEESLPAQVSEIFLLSPWYLDIVYVLQNLSPPLGMARNKSITLKLKAAKFCIMNNALYWKDPSGVLLNCLVEEEAKQVMEDFQKGDCGGHRFWKTTTNKILRAGYYWLSLFVDVYKNVASCHECQIFQGFKSKRKIYFCNKYQITLGNSTAYYPQGNGLAESSCKSLVNIIKKLLEMNKKSWHKKLVNALWADKVSQKKSIGMSPFKLMYDVDTVFPTSLAVLVVKLLQEEGSEDDHLQRRINQMIHLRQTREEVFQNTFKLQERIKKIYD